MTLPYLPGWWDEISKSATSFAGQLPQILQPDAVAEQRLQQMVAQNPMLLSQIENMTPEARMAMEQTLGFRKKTPLQKLPEGPELQFKRRQKSFMETATPQQLEDMVAKSLGTKGRTEMERETQEFDWKKRINELNFTKLTDDTELGKLLNDEKRRALEVLNKARVDNPEINIDRLIPGLMTGRLTQQDLAQIQVITADPALSGALNTVIDFAKLGQQNKLSLGLKSISNQDDYIRLALSAVESARKEYNDADNSLSRILNGAALTKINIEQARKADPQRAGMIDDVLARRNNALIRLQTYQPIVDKAFGITTPATGQPGAAPAGQATPSPTPTVPPVDQEAQMALAAIRQRPDQEKQIRAKYKQRTGKDLP